MQVFRLVLGIAVVLVLVLYITRPAELVSGTNFLSYDGEFLELNGRNVTQEELLAMTIPDDAEVIIDLTAAKHSDLGARSGLLHHWNQQGLTYYHAVEGVPLTVHQVSWRRATSQEIREEIDEENRLLRAREAARIAAFKPPPEPQNQTFSMEDPPPEPQEQPEGFVGYVPTDKNRYYYDDELLGTADQAQKFFQRLALTKPGALTVLVPEADAPPPNAQGIADLGFPPVVTDFMQRAARTGLNVQVHRGEGFRPPTTRSAVGVLGGLSFAYLGPILIALAVIFVVSWMLGGNKD
ncbi:MAG: hypothetical protein AAGK14_11285 [Verrucomicrobiota bacterium]